MIQYLENGKIWSLGAYFRCSVLNISSLESRPTTLIQNFISPQSIFHRRGPLHSHRACKNFRAFALVQPPTTKYLSIKFSKCSLRRKVLVCLGVYYTGRCSTDGKLILSCRPTPSDCLSPVPTRVLESEVVPVLGGKEPRVD